MDVRQEREYLVGGPALAAIDIDNGQPGELD
jgi:hypothetical protein